MLVAAGLRVAACWAVLIPTEPRGWLYSPVGWEGTAGMLEQGGARMAARFAEEAYLGGVCCVAARGGMWLGAHPTITDQGGGKGTQPTEAHGRQVCAIRGSFVFVCDFRGSFEGSFMFVCGFEGASHRREAGLCDMLGRQVLVCVHHAVFLVGLCALDRGRGPWASEGECSQVQVGSNQIHWVIYMWHWRVSLSA